MNKKVSQKPSVAAVISTHNRAEDLRQTIQMLRELNYPALHIIVIDNASTDDTCSMVRSEFPEVTLLPHSFNQAMAGYNAGFQRAQEAYVLVLDDDSCPAPGTLDAMVDFLESHADVGAAAGNIIDLDGSSEWEPRGKISFSSQWDNLIGCGFLIRRSNLLAAGCYKEEFELYYNDLDLALCILAQGYRIAYHRDWVVQHRKSPTNRVAERKIHMMMRNFSWIVRAHFSGARKWNLLLGHAGMALRDAKSTGCLWSGLKYVWQGFFASLPFAYMPVPVTAASKRFCAEYSLTGNLKKIFKKKVGVPEAPAEDLETYVSGPVPATKTFIAPAVKSKPIHICYWEHRITGRDTNAMRDEVAIRERRNEDRRIDCDCAKRLPQYRSPLPGYQLWLMLYSYVSCTDKRRMKKDIANWIYQPLVSIITPVYKIDPAFLAETLESIDGQVYSNWEFCVVDDGSNDPEIKALIDAFAAAHPGQVNSRFNTENSGICVTEQQALEMAKGDYVALLDHDDRLAPEALYECVKRINEKPDTDWVYSDLDKISPEGERILHFHKPDYSPDYLLCCNYILHLSVIRRSLMNDIGGFSMNCDGAQDYDLYLRLSEKTDRVEHIAKVLHSFRMAPGSTAGDLDAKPAIFEYGRKALQASLKRRGIDATVEHNRMAWGGHYRMKHNVEPVADEILVGGSSREAETEWAEIKLNKKIMCSADQLGAALQQQLDTTEAPFIIVRHEGVDIDEITLKDLFGHAALPGIGAISPKVVFNEKVDHCGLALGVGGRILFPLHGVGDQEASYGAVGAVTRNVSVSSPLITIFNVDAMRKSGGFDRSLQEGAIIDACLQLQDCNFRVVVDGGLIARLQTKWELPVTLLPGGHDFKELIKRRPTRMTAGDPYYNRNLNPDPTDFGGRPL